MNIFVYDKLWGPSQRVVTLFIYLGRLVGDVSFRRIFFIFFYLDLLVGDVSVKRGADLIGQLRGNCGQMCARKKMPRKFTFAKIENTLKY